MASEQKTDDYAATLIQKGLDPDQAQQIARRTQRTRSPAPQADLFAGGDAAPAPARASEARA